MNIKKYLRSRFDFRTALLLAILLHLLLFFLPEETSLFLTIPEQRTPVPPQDEQQTLDFRFVEVPNDKSEPNPDAPFLSDKDRRASTPEPQTKPGPDAVPDPASKGQNPEAMLSRIDPQLQRESRPVQKVKPDVSDTGSEKAAENMKPEKGKQWKKVETGDLEDMRDLQRQMIMKPKKPNLSMEDLNREFKFQDFQNPSSTIMRKGGIQFDTKGFDFGSWLQDFYYKVYSNWTLPLAFSAFRRSGQLTLRFYVHRDGSVSQLELVDGSGVESYDDAAMNAITLSNPFMPLPEGYPDDRMEIRCRFIYKYNPRPGSYGGWSKRRWR